jgi:hypothetical protein
MLFSCGVEKIEFLKMFSSGQPFLQQETNKATTWKSYFHIPPAIIFYLSLFSFDVWATDSFNSWKFSFTMSCEHPMVRVDNEEQWLSCLLHVDVQEILAYFRASRV